MRNHTRIHAIIAGTVAVAALALPSAAPAATTIFTEDAEGAVDAKWSVNEPGSNIEPWQKSDSGARKLRGNQANGGATSFWTGMQPQNWSPPPTVIAGESLLTLKQSILIPADGTTTIDYWSLWQNEGDDSGSLEVALADDGTVGKFRRIKSETVQNTAAGETDPQACDPTRPDITLQEPFEKLSASLQQYAGHKIVLRFNLTYGTENRPVSQPCGWYLDDVVVTTTGTPGNAGAPATGDGTTAPPAAKPTVSFTSAKLRGKKATLALKVDGGAISGAKITLKKGKKTVGTGKAATLEPGTRKVAVKLRRKLKKGTYTVSLTGKASDGSAVAQTGKVRAK